MALPALMSSNNSRINDDPKEIPEDDETPLDIATLQQAANTTSFYESVPESLRPFLYSNSYDTDHFHRSMAVNFFANGKKISILIMMAYGAPGFNVEQMLNSPPFDTRKQCYTKIFLPYAHQMDAEICAKVITLMRVENGFIGLMKTSLIHLVFARNTHRQQTGTTQSMWNGCKKISLSWIQKIKIFFQRKLENIKHCSVL
jgi:hypothetical protein